LHFCRECKKVVIYSHEDTCENCYQNYKPSEDGEICPNCGSENYFSHCSNCDAELDCNYLSDILHYDLADLEWINIDDLSTIKDYLLSVLSNR
jgi:predicted amidophosphoribosyltransferase